MALKANYIAFIGLSIFALFLIISYNQKANVPYERKTLHYTELLEEYYAYHNNSFKSKIQEVLHRTQELIRNEISGYNFPDDKNLEDYTPESNGKPVRSIIITTWRSGSTFLGDVLNAVPANYYHYEPLLDYGIIQIRGAPYAESALNVLKDLLNCNYNNLSGYLEYGRTHEYLFTHNTRLWSQCEPHDLCWNKTFLNDYCKLFPFQSMKVVRLRLKLAEELLKDLRLNAKVLLLVRDPRGTLQSRRHRDWCPGAPDCDNPNILCADMVSDYSAAVQLQSKYPNTFRAVRYEDLSLQPYEMVQDIFNFLGLDFHDSVKEFLETHTKLNVGGVSSTFRDSKSAPFHWRMDLNASEIVYIEENCDEAMKLWGYIKTNPKINLKDFNPITSYQIN